METSVIVALFMQLKLNRVWVFVWERENDSEFQARESGKLRNRNPTGVLERNTIFSEKFEDVWARKFLLRFIGEIGFFLRHFKMSLKCINCIFNIIVFKVKLNFWKTLNFESQKSVKAFRQISNFHFWDCQSGLINWLLN